MFSKVYIPHAIFAKDEFQCWMSGKRHVFLHLFVYYSPVGHTIECNSQIVNSFLHAIIQHSNALFWMQILGNIPSFWRTYLTSSFKSFFIRYKFSLDYFQDSNLLPLWKPSQWLQKQHLRHWTVGRRRTRLDDFECRLSQRRHFQMFWKILWKTPPGRTQQDLV